MDQNAQALGRMFAGMQMGNAVVQGQIYSAADNSWRQDVPAWFLPALGGARPVIVYQRA